MQKAKKKMLPVLVSTLAIVALATTPALAKDSQNKKSRHSFAKTAAEAAGHVPEQPEAPKAGHLDSQPGPAWKVIGGTVKNVHGRHLHRGRLRRQSSHAARRARHEAHQQEKGRGHRSR